MFNRMAKIQFFLWTISIGEHSKRNRTQNEFRTRFGQKTHPYTTFDNIMFDTSYTCILITSQLSEEN